MRFRRVKVTQVLKWLIILVPTVIAVFHFTKLHEKIRARKLVACHYSATSLCNETLTEPDHRIPLSSFHTFATKNGTLHTFNAYFDNRTALEDHPQIRILAYIDRVSFTPELFCQLWFTNAAPRVSKVTDVRLIWNPKWQQNTDGLSPFLLSCEAESPPTFVSFVESPCDASKNKLKVINEVTDHPHNFLVCVKGMQFSDDKMAPVLLEWIEIVKLFGAGKILFYVIKVSEAIKKVSKHHAEAEVIEIKFLSTKESELQSMMHDLIAYNDCLYRNIHTARFLVPIDVDEFIVPLVDTSWLELLTRTHKAAAQLYPNETFDAFAFRNAFFLLSNNHAGEIQPQVPAKFHFLQHVWRAANHNENSKHTKAFMDISRVLTVHNHMPLECFENGKCKTFLGDFRAGQVQHYREKCENYRECDDYSNNTVRDDNLWRFKEAIVSGVDRAMEKIFGN